MADDTQNQIEDAVDEIADAMNAALLARYWSEVPTHLRPPESDETTGGSEAEADHVTGRTKARRNKQDAAKSRAAKRERPLSEPVTRCPSFSPAVSKLPLSPKRIT